jgi:hypothetical protein
MAPRQAVRTDEASARPMAATDPPDIVARGRTMRESPAAPLASTRRASTRLAGTRPVGLRPERDLRGWPDHPDPDHPGPDRPDPDPPDPDPPGPDRPDPDPLRLDTRSGIRRLRDRRAPRRRARDIDRGRLAHHPARGPIGVVPPAPSHSARGPCRRPTSSDQTRS